MCEKIYSVGALLVCLKKISMTGIASPDDGKYTTFLLRIR
jgi:hypothetical protein